MAIEIVLAGLGFAAIASGILGGSSQTFTSIALLLLISALFSAILTLGLVRRSRIAYVIALLLGMVPALSWAYLVVTDTEFALWADRHAEALHRNPLYTGDPVGQPGQVPRPPAPPAVASSLSVSPTG